MKNIALFIAAFFVTSAKGQITKNNWLLGGILNYSSTDFNSDASSKIRVIQTDIQINAGYFFADKLAGGIKLSYGRNIFKQFLITGDYKVDDFNFGPFIRYYLLQAGKRFNIITEGMYQYGFHISSTNTTKNTFALTAGPVIYLNNTVGMEFLITYSTYKNSGYPGNNSALRIGLGFQFHLEKEE